MRSQVAIYAHLASGSLHATSAGNFEVLAFIGKILKWDDRMTKGTTEQSSGSARGILSFGLMTSVFVILAHAIAYLTHEYAHSFLAWLLGWMKDPLALDYGKPTLDNILFLGDVGDNVQYDPIFASGHGVAASAIALAGVVLGNGLLYAILYRISKCRWIAERPKALSFVYWLALACAGNVELCSNTGSDDPCRHRYRGQGLWRVALGPIPFLFIPALGVVHHFFTRMSAHSLPVMTGHSSAKLTLVVALTGYWFFVFYGGGGADGSYGLISQVLAILSKALLFPLSVIWLWIHQDFSNDFEKRLHPAE
jgi:hypothetical protein